MKPEEKDLLLKDLSGRLPYQVKVSVNGGKEPWTLKGMFEGEHTGMMLILEPSFPSKDVYPPTSNWPLSQCKPYLRPMSSMTEEEKKEYIEYAGYEIEESVNGRHYEYYLKDFCGTPDEPSVNTNGVDWLNKKMFDFRGLIPKDLALSTDEFNPYKD